MTQTFLSAYYTNGSSLAAIDYSDATPDVFFQYDRLGRMTSAIVAGVSTNTHAYDPETLALSVETQNGVVITRSTDALGRDSGFSLGSDYSVQYGYDAYGRFVGVTSSVASASLGFAYSYLEDCDLLSGMTTSSGFLWARAYESARFLITSVENRYGEAVISRYAYENDELGQRTSVVNTGLAFSDAGEAMNLYGYNPRSEVTDATRHWGTDPGNPGDAVVGQSWVYDYDPIGNRTYAQRAGYGAEYTANELNQYTAREVPGVSHILGTADEAATVTVNAEAVTRQDAYWYKDLEVANDTSAAYPEVEIAATYSNLFTSVTGRVFVAETPEAFQYDSDGNLTQDGRFDYTWNGENRLIKAETRDDLPAAVPRVRVEYAYDHQGRMVWKQISTNAVVLSTRTLLWDGYNIVQETICNQQSSITNSYVWGLDLSSTLQGAGGVGGLLAEIKDGVPHYAAFDANGNVTEYLSTNGLIAAHYEYSPFGEIVVQSGVPRQSAPGATAGDLADSFTHRFSTKPWCPVTGLSEYEFRKYSPPLGRWLSRDPIGETGGLNSYCAVNNCGVDDYDVVGLQPAKRTDGTEVEKPTMPKPRDKPLVITDPLSAPCKPDQVTLIERAAEAICKDLETCECEYEKTGYAIGREAIKRARRVCDGNGKSLEQQFVVRCASADYHKCKGSPFTGGPPSNGYFEDGKIYLCPRAFEQSEKQLKCTFAHELGHWGSGGAGMEYPAGLFMRCSGCPPPGGEGSPWFKPGETWKDWEKRWQRIQ